MSDELQGIVAQYHDCGNGIISYCYDIELPNYHCAWCDAAKVPMYAFKIEGNWRAADLITGWLSFFCSLECFKANLVFGDKASARG